MIQFNLDQTYYNEQSNSVVFILQDDERTMTQQLEIALDNAASFAGKVLAMKEDITPDQA